LVVKIRDFSFHGVVAIAIDGELEHANVALLENRLSDYLAAGRRRILIDLQACTFMDSGGLGVFVFVCRDLPDGGVLAVAAPSPHIKRLFETVGLIGHKRFEVYDDIASARAAVSLE
jgi:anti-anti-sigma factor